MRILKYIVRIIYKQLHLDVVRSWVREVYSYIFRNYKYRVFIINAHGIKEKLPLLLQNFRRLLTDRRKILCYPERPLPGSVLYKILLFLGYHTIVDPKKNCDIAIQWLDTWDGDPFLPRPPQLLQLANTSGGPEVLNLRCKDVTKVRMGAVFEEVFGYSISVDPHTYNGKCVMKSNWNALHLGQIIESPREDPGDKLVYEKIINNEVGDGLVEDIRVPVFKNRIPLVYLKYRPIENRFVDRKNINTKAVIAEVFDIFSKDEINKIVSFFDRFGLEYGEVDVLRDRDDGRIYIVDINHTPWGPPHPINEDDKRTAIFRLARAFEEAFSV